ncbi:hypothetical protein KCU65_g437, partial [Aureobasidium melanogenum]
MLSYPTMHSEPKGKLAQTLSASRRIIRLTIEACCENARCESPAIYPVYLLCYLNLTHPSSTQATSQNAKYQASWYFAYRLVNSIAVHILTFPTPTHPVVLFGDIARFLTIESKSPLLQFPIARGYSFGVWPSRIPVVDRGLITGFVDCQYCFVTRVGSAGSFDRVAGSAPASSSAPVERASSSNSMAPGSACSKNSSGSKSLSFGSSLRCKAPVYLRRLTGGLAVLDDFRFLPTVVLVSTVASSSSSSSSASPLSSSSSASAVIACAALIQLRVPHRSISSACSGLNNSYHVRAVESRAPCWSHLGPSVISNAISYLPNSIGAVFPIKLRRTPASGTHDFLSPRLVVTESFPNDPGWSRLQLFIHSYRGFHHTMQQKPYKRLRSMRHKCLLDVRL